MLPVPSRPKRNYGFRLPSWLMVNKRRNMTCPQRPWYGHPATMNRGGNPSSSTDAPSPSTCLKIRFIWQPSSWRWMGDHATISHPKRHYWERWVLVPKSYSVASMQWEVKWTYLETHWTADWHTGVRLCVEWPKLICGTDFKSEDAEPITHGLKPSLYLLYLFA